MDRIPRVRLMVIVLVGLLAAGFLAGHTWPRRTSAKGPWSAVSVIYLCNNCGIGKDAPGNAVGKPEPGDPNGPQYLLVNLIAKLDRDGCEWQWRPTVYYDPERHAARNYQYVLFRC